MKADFVADMERFTQSQIQGILTKRRIKMFTKNDIKTRFERTTGGAFQGIDIITDKVTGVQYLLATRDTGAGLTPLIDGDGKPVLSKTETDKEKSVSDKYVSPF